MTGTKTFHTQTQATARRISVRSPELLHISGGGRLSFGAHQVWYPSWIGRMGGCGPTAASNLLWYLTATRPESCAPLFDRDGTNRADMLKLMEAVWKYVTPGMRGVDRACKLTDGAIRYAADRGVALAARTLEIPSQPDRMPSAAEVGAFLETAFSDDLPVAFLNLSAGAVRGLDNWHWVTLISLESPLRAEMYDQSRRQMIDLALWLETTKGGGAFVALEPEESKHSAAM